MADDEEGSAEVGYTETTTEQKRYPHPAFPRVTVWDLPGIGTPRFNAKQYLEKVHFKQYDFFIIVASNRFTENDRKLANEIREMKRKFYYETLENDLDDLKRDGLILAMPAFSKEGLEKKKAALESLIWKAALVSCGIGAIPVPGLSLICDIGILVGTMTHFYNVFGLDEGSLHRLANRVGKPVAVLQSAIKKSPMAHDITVQLVTDLLSKATLQQELMVIKPALKAVPVLGFLVGGALSFATTFYILKNFLDDVVKDAENVWAKAMESQIK
ncbi:UNVERIFIED_CONTAM: hypothetical protein K2H54_026579 [Gekko kuhli]